jgi:hypothetical protein
MGISPLFILGTVFADHRNRIRNENAALKPDGIDRRAGFAHQAAQSVNVNAERVGHLLRRQCERE